MLQITAVGYVAFDPESRTTNTGLEVANFKLLVNKKIQELEVVNEIMCSVWGTRAKPVIDYIKRGSLITIVGQGYIETFTRKNGDPGACFNVNVNEFTLPARPKEVATEDMPF